jgi:hypothetical protein
LSSANWCGSGSWFLFDADPDFYLMRIRIQVTKMMRIHTDPDRDPRHWTEGEKNVVDLIWRRGELRVFPTFSNLSINPARRFEDRISLVPMFSLYRIHRTN